MCEILIHINDSGSSRDPFVESTRFHPGDVVTIQEDGWKWSGVERSGAFKLVKMPGVPANQLAQLVGTDLGLTDAQGNTMFTDSSPALPRLRIMTIPGYATLESVLSAAAPSTWISNNAVTRTPAPNPSAVSGTTVIGS